MFADLTFSGILTVLGCLLVSMTAHEAMHAFTAHALGDTTAQEQGRLTLNPLKHVDIFLTVLLPTVLMLLHQPPFFIAKPVPFDPSRVKYEEYGAALVAIAGPFTNFLLACLGALVLRFAGLSSGAVQVVDTFVVVNILFFVFNMIPFPPLDGSRLLYAFAPDFLREIMAQIERLGFTGIIVFMLILFPVISPAVSNAENAIYHFLLR